MSRGRPQLWAGHEGNNCHTNYLIGLWKGKADFSQSFPNFSTELQPSSLSWWSCNLNDMLFMSWGTYWRWVFWFWSRFELSVSSGWPASSRSALTSSEVKEPNQPNCAIMKQILRRWSHCLTVPTGWWRRRSWTYSPDDIGRPPRGLRKLLLLILPNITTIPKSKNESYQKCLIIKQDWIIWLIIMTFKRMRKNSDLPSWFSSKPYGSLTRKNLQLSG